MHRCESAVDVVPCPTASPIHTDFGSLENVAMYSVAKNPKPFELRPAQATETGSRPQ
jgi:hypothetical protein